MSQMIFKLTCPLSGSALKSARLLTTSSKAIAVEHKQYKVNNVIHVYKLEKINYAKELERKPHHLEQLAASSGYLTLKKSGDSRPNPCLHMSTTPTNAIKDVPDKQNQASLEQLEKIADAMTYHLPRFFNTPHPFQLYSKNVVFLDNVRQVRIEGLGQYATRIGLIKLYHRLRYTSSGCEVLNLVKHPEESCVKIRWRIVSKPGLMQFIFFFYKYHSLEQWTDGVSTLHVNSEGKIYCHVCDNIDIDESKTEIKKTIKNPLVDRGLNV